MAKGSVVRSGGYHGAAAIRDNSSFVYNPGDIIESRTPTQSVTESSIGDTPIVRTVGHQTYDPYLHHPLENL